ncbi:protein of unknown function [Magnetospirillum sp. XM-1]|uniref:hypothetical protein n=1 Tax=Magnetospirillum sp. XM-1 TaxID=1663591 RepID=UPI00073E05E2|nr:hypothetical protein [Magnetospirillum sp. XM-1]CUW38792.1 protein of unknown function [Magnetospirillum sp. XM-1]
MADEALDVSPTSDSAVGAADTATTVTDTAAEAAAPDVNDAASSSSADDQGVPETKEDLLSIVKKAAQEDQEVPDGNSPDPEKREASETDDAGQAQTDEQSDEKLPFGKHPRWKALIEERNAYKAEATEYRKITDFMREHRVEPTEAADALQAAAMVKGAFEGRIEPKEALAFIDRWRGQLAQMAGLELPDDLRERVEQGYVDEDSAAELAAARSRANIAAAQTQAQVQRQAQQEAAAAATALQTEAANWEAQKSASDPDYSRKQKAVERYARALIAEHGAPANPTQVRQLLEAAYKEVNSTFVVPSPQPTAPSPRSHSSATAGNAPAPKSFAEAVALAARAS